MKKTVLISLLLLFLTTNTMAQEMKKDELVDIASFVTQEHLKVEKWEVTWKDKMNKDQIQKLVVRLNKDNKMTRTEDDLAVKYFAKDTHKQSGIAVFYKVVIPRDDKYDAELIAVMEGTSWNENIKEHYQSKKALIVHQLFTKNAKTYTCLVTQNDGIMSSDYFFEAFTKYFKLQQKNTQFDTVVNSSHKKIIYGYTPIWEHNMITINGTQMNVQVAETQNENEHPKYTIGTPILINEY